MPRPDNLSNGPKWTIRRTKGAGRPFEKMNPRQVLGVGANRVLKVVLRANAGPDWGLASQWEAAD